ncbi:hypothetical protein [Mucilaginibacter antarcticus]|uniref:hypothetical protein n=1 Tax=Mucilaginibacter antarcticus TaxID=1855725 RepID=UPI0036337B8C
MKYTLILASLVLASPAIVKAQTNSAAIRQANLEATNPTNAEVFTPYPTRLPRQKP